jgi:hypothetical protein
VVHHGDTEDTRETANDENSIRIFRQVDILERRYGDAEEMKKMRK